MMTLALASCSLDTQNPSAMEGEVIFSTPKLANTVVMGLHQSFGETNSYRGRYIPYFGINSDCEIFNNYGGVANPATDKEGSLACYSASVDNTYMNTSNNAWAKLYEAIERANKGIEDIEQHGDMNNRDMKHLYGELLTLRAMIYFDLVKAWGDVPGRFETVNSSTIYLPRSPRAEVLQRCIDDLDKAKDLVYAPRQGYASSTERVSTSFARGLRARIALFLAGKSMQNDGKLDYNISDAAKRNELYDIALKDCEYVIANHPSKLQNLKFIDNFMNLSQEVTTAGLESLFEIPFSDGRGRVLYTWGGKHSTADQFTGLAKGGVNGPIPTLWYDYNPVDVRRDITCVPYVWADSGEKYEDITLTEKSTSNLIAGGWSFGKLRFEWMNRRVVSTNDDGINWQVMRLADVYMMAAEAANELDQLSKAKSYIEPVLNRAYPAAVASEKLTAANSKSAFFNLIVDERKFEFAGEAIRKVDLIRWGILGEKMREAKQNLTDLANRQGKYAGYPHKFYYNKNLGGDLSALVSMLMTGTKDMSILNGYDIYGMENGQTDDEGKALKRDNSTYVFTLSADKNADKEKVKKYLDNFIIGDPDQKMFWPIWKVFIDSSNGQLVNYFGY